MTDNTNAQTSTSANTASTANIAANDANAVTPTAATTTMGELLPSLTPARVAEAIQAAGCAVSTVEHDGVVRLHSASHGVGFQVLWGNVAAPGHYLDLTLSCPLRVQGGELPVGVLADWHRSKRFARVAQHGDFVVLEMDVLAAGGISPAHLAVVLQLWTQMMGQFFVHLRNFRSADAAAVPAEAEAAPAAA